MSEDAFGERTLSAAEYFEGRLDWHAFDVNAGVALGGAADRPGESVVRSVIPAPVSYRGMPAARFWEFEDARLDVGVLQLGPTDLPHLLLIEYAGKDRAGSPLIRSASSAARWRHESAIGRGRISTAALRIAPRWFCW